jgi:hypothetical protein
MVFVEAGRRSGEVVDAVMLVFVRIDCLKLLSIFFRLVAFSAHFVVVACD